MDWDHYPDWQSAETAWEEKASHFAKSSPLKGLKQLPLMPGITTETAKHLKWKSLKYILKHDHRSVIRRYFFKRPIKYTLSFFKSCLKKKSYRREGDFFLYGLSSLKDFEKKLEDKETLFVVGFSYCHKPLECPSGRFTSDCQRQSNHPVCSQCFIGKSLHALSEHNSIPLIIPTIHYIGEKIFEIVTAHPHKPIVFLITACEMTLEMFGDWGNMVGIQGIGVRLDGRICNTMKAFELSENGIKPGLTVVLPETQRSILDLLRHHREAIASRENRQSPLSSAEKA